MVIKLLIDEFELGICFFRFRDWWFQFPILNPKNTNPQFKITNCQMNFVTYWAKGQFTLGRFCQYIGLSFKGIVAGSSRDAIQLDCFADFLW